MNIATVLLSSDPVSMMRKHNGIISVVSRKLITSEESFFTSAPMTPREVRRRYSNGRDLEVVLRNGYRKSGMCAVASSVLHVAYRCRQLTAQEKATSLGMRGNALK